MLKKSKNVKFCDVKKYNFHLSDQILIEKLKEIGEMIGVEHVFQYTGYRNVKPVITFY